MKSKIQILKKLQEIPGVGKSIAEDLWSINIKSPQDLKGQDPEMLYKKICLQAGMPVDRCMLYILRCAVYFASHDQHRPGLLKWWNWSDARLQEQNQLK